MSTQKSKAEFAEKVARRLAPWVHKLARYHDYKVFGLKHIPEEGPAIIAVTHSLATYDISLLFHTIFESKGRFVRPLADHFFFRVPYLGEFIEDFVGAVEGNPANAEELVAQGELIGVAPGGMREALRPSSERYQIRWENRRGFVRLAMKHQIPLILAVCPKADDLYEIYPSPLTKWAYKTFKAPLAVARGLGLSAIPKPAKLTHFLSEPMYPPPAPEDPVEFEKALKAFHRKVVARAEQLIGKAIAFHPKSAE